MQSVEQEEEFNTTVEGNSVKNIEEFKYLESTFSIEGNKIEIT